MSGGLESLKRLLDAEVVEILLKALAFDPRDRFTSGADLTHAVSKVEVALVASGTTRRLIAAMRFLRAAAAAFFVALRYGSVAVLLASYVAIVLSCFAVKNPAPLLAFIVIGLLHFAIRWEGPETPEEAKLRSTKQVVARRPIPRR